MIRCHRFLLAQFLWTVLLLAGNTSRVPAQEQALGAVSVDDQSQAETAGVVSLPEIAKSTTSTTEIQAPGLEYLLKHLEAFRKAHTPFHIRHREVIKVRNAREIKVIESMGLPPGMLLDTEYESAFWDNRSWKRCLSLGVDGEQVSDKHSSGDREGTAGLNVPFALLGVFIEPKPENCKLTFDDIFPRITTKAHASKDDFELWMIPVSGQWIPKRIRITPEAKDEPVLEWEVNHVRSYGKDRPPCIIDGEVRLTVRDGDQETTITNEFFITKALYGDDVVPGEIDASLALMPDSVHPLSAAAPPEQVVQGPPTANVRVYALKNARVAETARIIEQLYDHALSVAVDERTNSLIVRGTDEMAEEVQALLMQLDDAAGATQSTYSPAGLANDVQDVKSGSLKGFEFRGEPGPDPDGVSFYLRTTGQDSNELRQQYDALERQTRSLSEQLRKPLPDPANGERLKSQLHEAVRQAFETRQKLQRAELAVFVKRLQGIQQSIEMREKISQQIIEHRVQELLDPNLKWETPEANSGRAQALRSRERGSTSDASTPDGSRRAALFPSSATDKSPAEIHELLAQRAEQVRQIREHISHFEKRIAAGQEIEDSRRSLESLRRQLDEYSRKQEIAWEEYRQHIKLLDANLELEDSRLKLAEDKEKTLEGLIEQGLRPVVEFQETKLKVQQARVAKQQAEALLKVYRQAGEGLVPPVEISTSSPQQSVRYRVVFVPDGIEQEIETRKNLSEHDRTEMLEFLKGSFSANRSVADTVTNQSHVCIDRSIASAVIDRLVEMRLVRLCDDITAEAGDSFRELSLRRELFDGEANKTLWEVRTLHERDREHGIQLRRLTESAPGDTSAEPRDASVVVRLSPTETAIMPWYFHFIEDDTHKTSRMQWHGEYFLLIDTANVDASHGESQADSGRSAANQPIKLDDLQGNWRLIVTAQATGKNEGGKTERQVLDATIRGTRLKASTNPVQAAGNRDKNANSPMRFILHLDGVGDPQPLDLEYVLEASEAEELKESIDYYALRNGKPIAQAIIERHGNGFRICIEHARIVGRPLAIELSETAVLWELRPIEPADSTSGLAPAVETILTGLEETKAKIRNLSVTTDYIKRQRFLLPFDSTLEMQLTTKAIIDSEGRARNETDGQQVNIEPDGKAARTYRGRWVGVFQDGVARRLTWYEDNPPSASIDDALSWHGIDPQEFTTHFLHDPVTEIIRSSGAQIAERTEWDGRPVTILETTPRGDKEQRRYRFWIDTERKIVVRRAIVIRFAEGQPWQEYARIEARDHHEVAPGIWLPDKVKYESLEVTADLTPEKLSLSYEGINRDWQVNRQLPADTFELAFPEGTPVNDHRAPQGAAIPELPQALETRKKTGMN